jgi:hypothetical protein
MKKIYEKPCLEVESVEIDGMIAITAKITSDGSDPVVITNNGNSSDPNGDGKTDDAVTSADTKAWGRGVYWE